MHRIEQFILTRLIEEPKLRYSELKPSHMEGSLFMYHLKHLIDRDLVRKDAAGSYELTSDGKLYADKLHLETQQLYQQPRIVVLVACHDDKQGWLLFRRRTQPTINMIGFPHVNLQLGTELAANAEAVLGKDSGLTVKLRPRGYGYITLYQRSEPESYIMFHLLYGQNPRGELKPSSDLGDFFWSAKPDLKDPDMIPSMPVLLKHLKSPQEHFFLELNFELPS